MVFVLVLVLALVLVLVPPGINKCEAYSDWLRWCKSHDFERAAAGEARV